RYSSLLSSPLKDSPLNYGILNLGGIAAELLVFKRSRSGPAAQDLSIAFEAAFNLRQAGHNIKLGDIDIDFQKFFSFKITKEENQILNFMLDRAKKKLKFKYGKLIAAANLLHEHKKLSYEQLKSLLGNRDRIEVLQSLAFKGLIPVEKRVLKL